MFHACFVARFFFNETATTEIYTYGHTLSLHDALPICGIAYLPVGAPTFDRWGADRKGANLYSNSVVAVDAATGKYLWHFQTVHHDIWDLDLPRSEEHTSELQSLMRISYAVFCLKKKK